MGRGIAVRWFVGLLTVAALAVPASAGASAFPGANGRIAFAQASGNGLTDSIFTVNPDGSGIKQLTSGHVDFAPRFSADAKSIVFTRNGFASSGGSASHVMLMRSDGSGLTDLSTADAGTPFSDGDPSFSPDGAHVVFDRFDNSSGHFVGIFEIAVAGSSVTAVRLTTGQDVQPTFSPDGSHIAFGRQVNDTTQAIFTTLPVPAAPVQQVTHPPTDSFDLAPDYSPNGTRIAFERDVSIMVTNADGSGSPTALTHSSPPQDDADPAYSPDGTKIVFASTRGTLNQSGPGGSQADGLYTMNASDGSNVTPVPGLAGNASFSNQTPDWGTAATPQPPSPPPASGCGTTSEPDRNGDLHSNCHTGAKGRGAGGNDKPPAPPAKTPVKHKTK